MNASYLMLYLLSMCVVMVAFLGAWLFASLFDTVMIYVLIGFMFGVVTTISMCFVFGVGLIRPPVARYSETSHKWRQY